MDWLATVVAVFLATAVEVVEVVTIVLALGLTRGWRSTLIGAAVAGLVLALLTAFLGTALERWIDYRESRGKRGSPAPDSLGGYPREQSGALVR